MVPPAYLWGKNKAGNRVLWKPKIKEGETQFVNNVKSLTF